MPSTLLAVDGSARTLICVDVTPPTGPGVGVAGRGVTVSDAKVVLVTGSLEAVTRGVGVEMVSSLGLDLQPVYRRIKTVKITLENRLDTLRFYRLSYGERNFC
jgi:hypothetical protein